MNDAILEALQEIKTLLREQLIALMASSGNFVLKGADGSFLAAPESSFDPSLFFSFLDPCLKCEITNMHSHDATITITDTHPHAASAPDNTYVNAYRPLLYKFESINFKQAQNIARYLKSKRSSP